MALMEGSPLGFSAGSRERAPNLGEEEPPSASLDRSSEKPGCRKSDADTLTDVPTSRHPGQGRSFLPEAAFACVAGWQLEGRLPSTPHPSREQVWTSLHRALPAPCETVAIFESGVPGE